MTTKITMSKTDSGEARGGAKENIEGQSIKSRSTTAIIVHQEATKHKPDVQMCDTFGEHIFRRASASDPDLFTEVSGMT